MADAGVASGMMHPVDQIDPGLHVLRVLIEFQEAQDLCVQTFAAEFDGDGVDGVYILHRDDAGIATLQKSAIFFFRSEGCGGRCAEQDVGLNSDAQHFFHAVLRWLGF